MVSLISHVLWNQNVDQQILAEYQKTNELLAELVAVKRRKLEITEQECQVNSFSK